jgi:hypothetical protein
VSVLLTHLAGPLRLAFQNDIKSIRRIALLGDEGACWKMNRGSFIGNTPKLSLVEVRE